jgi:hypothetical protein
MPFYRNCFFYHDGTFRVGDSTWRYRITVTPASNVPMPDLGVEPAWGDDPSDEVWFKILGRIVFENPEGNEAGFTELPCGFPELPIFKLSMNLRSFASEAMAALRDFIVLPIHPSGGTLNGRDFPTNNVWRIFIDRTGVGTNVALFQEHFCGVQTPGISTKFTNNRISRTTRVDVELQHILRRCLGLAWPTDATTAMAGATPVYGLQEKVYDKYWVNGASTKSYHVVQKQGSGDKRGLAQMFKWVDLWGAVQSVVSYIYATYLRVPIGGGVQFHSVRDVLAFGGFTTGTPYDAFTMHKDSYAADGSKGAALNLEDQLIIGWVRRNDDNDILVGGYFYDDGPSSAGICRYKTLWDWVTDQFKAGGTKAVVRHPEHGYILIYCHRLFASYIADPVVTADDCLGGDEVWEVGANVQSGASVEIKGGDGSDLSPIDYLYTSEEETDWSVAMSMHNLPDTRKPTKLESYAGLASIGGYEIAHEGFRVNCFYYFDTPPGFDLGTFSLLVPVRVHNFVTWHNGIADQSPCQELYACPVPTDDLDGHEEIEDQIWFPLVKLLIQMTFGSCMPYAIAQQMSVTFGSPQQTLYEITVGLDKLNWQDSGQRIDGAAWASANIFLPAGETWCSTVPGQPVVLRGQESLKEGTFKAKLLAPDP